MAPKGLNPPRNGGPAGQDSSMKISGNFINFYALKKPNFICLWYAPPSSSNSSNKMGCLDSEPLYSTWCSSITSMSCTSKFHLNELQYSVRGDVMLDTVTYGKDCITMKENLGH